VRSPRGQTDRKRRSAVPGGPCRLEDRNSRRN
jgi:hypothetical protein